MLQRSKLFWLVLFLLVFTFFAVYQSTDVSLPPSASAVRASFHHINSDPTVVRDDNISQSAPNNYSSVQDDIIPSPIVALAAFEALISTAAEHGLLHPALHRLLVPNSSFPVPKSAPCGVDWRHFLRVAGAPSQREQLAFVMAKAARGAPIHAAVFGTSITAGHGCDGEHCAWYHSVAALIGRLVGRGRAARLAVGDVRRQTNDADGRPLVRSTGPAMSDSDSGGERRSASGGSSGSTGGVSGTVKNGRGTTGGDWGMMSARKSFSGCADGVYGVYAGGSNGRRGVKGVVYGTTVRDVRLSTVRDGRQPLRADDAAADNEVRGIDRAGSADGAVGAVASAPSVDGAGDDTAGVTATHSLQSTHAVTRSALAEEVGGLLLTRPPGGDVVRPHVTARLRTDRLNARHEPRAPTAVSADEAAAAAASRALLVGAACGAYAVRQSDWATNDRVSTQAVRGVDAPWVTATPSQQKEFLAYKQGIDRGAVLMPLTDIVRMLRQGDERWGDSLDTRRADVLDTRRGAVRVSAATGGGEILSHRTARTLGRRAGGGAETSDSLGVFVSAHPRAASTPSSWTASAAQDVDVTLADDGYEAKVLRHHAHCAHASSRDGTNAHTNVTGRPQCSPPRSGEYAPLIGRLLQVDLVLSEFVFISPRDGVDAAAEAAEWHKVIAASNPTAASVQTYWDGEDVIAQSGMEALHTALGVPLVMPGMHESHPNCSAPTHEAATTSGQSAFFPHALHPTYSYHRCYAAYVFGGMVAAAVEDALASVPAAAAALRESNLCCVSTQQGLECPCGEDGVPRGAAASRRNGHQHPEPRQSERRHRLHAQAQSLQRHPRPRSDEGKTHSPEREGLLDGLSELIHAARSYRVAAATHPNGDSIFREVDNNSSFRPPFSDLSAAAAVLLSGLQGWAARALQQPPIINRESRTASRSSGDSSASLSDTRRTLSCDGDLDLYYASNWSAMRSRVCKRPMRDVALAVFHPNAVARARPMYAVDSVCSGGVLFASDVAWKPGLQAWVRDVCNASSSGSHSVSAVLEGAEGHHRHGQRQHAAHGGGTIARANTNASMRAPPHHYHHHHGVSGSDIQSSDSEGAGAFVRRVRTASVAAFPPPDMELLSHSAHRSHPPVGTPSRLQSHTVRSASGTAVIDDNSTASYRTSQMKEEFVHVLLRTVRDFIGITYTSGYTERWAGSSAAVDIIYHPLIKDFVGSSVDTKTPAVLEQRNQRLVWDGSALTVGGASAPADARQAAVGHDVTAGVPPHSLSSPVAHSSFVGGTSTAPTHVAESVFVADVESDVRLAWDGAGWPPPDAALSSKLHESAISSRSIASHSASAITSASRKDRLAEAVSLCEGSSITGCPAHPLGSTSPIGFGVDPPLPFVLMPCHPVTLAVMERLQPQQLVTVRLGNFSSHNTQRATTTSGVTYERPYSIPAGEAVCVRISTNTTFKLVSIIGC